MYKYTLYWKDTYGYSCQATVWAFSLEEALEEISNLSMSSLIDYDRESEDEENEQA